MKIILTDLLFRCKSRVFYWLNRTNRLTIVRNLGKNLFCLLEFCVRRFSEKPGTLPSET